MCKSKSIHSSFVVSFSFCSLNNNNNNNKSGGGTFKQCQNIWYKNAIGCARLKREEQDGILFKIFICIKGFLAQYNGSLSKMQSDILFATTIKGKNVDFFRHPVVEVSLTCDQNYLMLIFTANLV